MSFKEKLLNISFGLSLIYWGVAGFLHSYNGLETPTLRWVITLLNFTVGLLIIFRSPVFNKGSVKSIAMSLPSLICGGLLFKLAKPLVDWSLYLQVVFILGAVFALTAFLFLGRSFSIFPDVRKIKSMGVFSIVRHPSYLGEIIMITACLLATQYWQSFLVYMVFIPSIVLRIKEEEDLLIISSEYRNYQKNVKWRLLPYVW